ncbi:MAG: hypothetical protein M1812_007382 [Candelaria pacifica]|nr:MAG: hypothetical protein M1812_007382 [Candelaria pacifica]
MIHTEEFMETMTWIQEGSDVLNNRFNSRHPAISGRLPVLAKDVKLNDEVQSFLSTFGHKNLASLREKEQEQEKKDNRYFY